MKIMVPGVPGWFDGHGETWLSAILPPKAYSAKPRKISLGQPSALPASTLITARLSAKKRKFLYWRNPLTLNTRVLVGRVMNSAKAFFSIGRLHQGKWQLQSATQITSVQRALVESRE